MISDGNCAEDGQLISCGSGCCLRMRRDQETAGWTVTRTGLCCNSVDWAFVFILLYSGTCVVYFVNGISPQFLKSVIPIFIIFNHPSIHFLIRDRITEAAA